jgi:RNA polymerase sigma-70 factor (ECF subfamily)
MISSRTTSFQLIERIKKGDRDAFNPLFEKYRKRLAVWIFYRLSASLRAYVEIDDLLQETFLRAYRQFDDFTYQSSGSFMRWISRIAEHVIADAARFQGRAKRHAPEIVPLRSPSNPAGVEPIDLQTPSRIFSRQEQLGGLIARLGALPANYREVIILAKIEGLTTQEIAERLGKSREGAALLLCRALKSYRETLVTPPPP